MTVVEGLCYCNNMEENGGGGENEKGGDVKGQSIKPYHGKL